MIYKFIQTFSTNEKKKVTPNHNVSIIGFHITVRAFLKKKINPEKLFVSIKFVK